MSKIRVGQLAKELKLKVPQVIAMLTSLGVEAKTNLSTIEAEAAQKVRTMSPATPAEKSAAKAAKPLAPRKTPAKTAARKAGKESPAAKTPAAPVAAKPSAAAPRAPVPARPAAPTGPSTPPGHSAKSPTAGAAPRPGAPRTGLVTVGAQRPGVSPTGPVARPAAASGRISPIGPRPPAQGPAMRPAVPASRPGPVPMPQGPRPQGPSPVGPRGVDARTPRPATAQRPATSPTPPVRPAIVPSPARPAPRPAPSRRAEHVATPPRPSTPPPPPLPEVFKEITITEGVTIKELSEKMDRKAKDLISRLLAKGIFANINQPLDTKIASEVCKEFGFDAKIVSFEEQVAREEAEVAVAENLRQRDPVVTIMGHVDHGKTSLLDAIRESNIVATEAGGITQHIGAYHIRRKNRGITFIDTPGHEAFTLMRARGARVTDIVVLVVAADDGVMPQTIEAMDHAKAAGVAQVVAINKIDKPGANLDRVKKQLSDRGLLVEDWGGQVVAVPVSAKMKTGINELLEMLLLVADIADLKADATSLASGTVLESRLDKSRGPVATILVQRGTLRVGDPFIAGAVHGKVRAMFDDLGHRVREAGPSIPVEVLGLEGVPGAGDPFQVLEEEWKVRQIGAFRQQKLRQETMAKSSRLTLDHLYAQIKEGTVKELPLVVKADVQGSVEALTKTLQDLPSDKVKTRIIHAGSGAITETDVLLASASNAIIIGYNVRPERGAQELAEKEKVDIRLHSVIYDITNEIKNAMMGMLEPEAKEVYMGRAEVRQTFKVPKVGTIAGCQVSDGRIARNSEVRLLRDNVVVFTGKVSSLRRFKEDASEVKSGYECGIGLANYNDLKAGDVIEAFRIDKIAAKSL